MKNTILIMFFLLSNLFNQVFAQVGNPDSLYTEARKNAENKNYDLSIEQINKLVSAYPENMDYSTYLANLYYWSEQYDLAQKQALQIFNNSSSNEETLNLLVRIELAGGKSKDLLKHSEQGITLFPGNKDFYILHKAQALEQLGRDKEALLTLEEIDKGSDYFPNAQYIKTQILRKQKNMVSVGYLNTSFSNPGFPPWHFGMIEYMRKTKNNAFVGRVNYGSLFGTSGMQAEIDAYPKLGKNKYLYLNTGISNGSTVFPLFRFGAEYYQDFKKYSTSIGGRYLHFENAKVLMFTGHIGRNFNTYNLSYRPYLVTINGDWFTSHIISLRKTFEEKESFIQLDLQYGAVPYYFFVSNEFLRTNALRAGINCRFRVSDNFFIQPILMYEFEEFVPNEYRNRYNVQLILSKRF